MKVLLVKCPRLIENDFEENSESLALSYLCASLRKIGLETNILNASLFDLSIEETVEKIIETEYGLIGFTITDPTLVEPTITVIKELRKQGISAHITMGGQTPTFHYEEILGICPELDSIVRFEGEITIVELAKTIAKNGVWRAIEGIAFRKNGRTLANRPRPLVENLDNLPFPARDTLPFILENKPDIGVVSLAGARGCYMDCSFCSIRAFYTIPKGVPLRFRSSSNIVSEVESLVENHGVRDLLFVDDVFVGPGKKNVQRIFQLADEIERNNLKVMFSVSERVDNVNKQVFSRLKEVGLRQIFLGIESGNEEILDYLDKGITLKQIEEAIDIFEQLNLDMTVSFINFTPITTIEHLEHNLNFFLSLKVNILLGLLNRLHIYGGTPLFEKLHKEGRIQGKFPNLSFRALDARVDMVYDIVRDTLGTFPPIAYELKRIARLIRKSLFEAEVGGHFDIVARLQRQKMEFRKLTQDIMTEAGMIFKEIIDFAKSTKSDDSNAIKSFKKRMTDTSMSTYNGWINMLKFFEHFCLGSLDISTV